MPTRSFHADEELDAWLDDQEKPSTTVREALNHYRETQGQSKADRIREEIEEECVRRTEINEEIADLEDERETIDENIEVLKAKLDDVAHEQADAWDDVRDALEQMVVTPLGSKARRIHADEVDTVPAEAILDIAADIHLHHYRGGDWPDGDRIEDDLEAAGFDIDELQDGGFRPKVTDEAACEFLNGLTPREEDEARQAFEERFS